MRTVLATIAASALLAGSAMAHCNGHDVTAETKKPLVTTDGGGPITTPPAPAKPRA